MGKKSRKNEPKALKGFLSDNNISVIGEIKYPGIMDYSEVIILITFILAFYNPNRGIRKRM